MQWRSYLAGLIERADLLNDPVDRLEFLREARGEISDGLDTLDAEAAWDAHVEDRAAEAAARLDLSVARVEFIARRYGRAYGLRKRPSRRPRKRWDGSGLLDLSHIIEGDTADHVSAAHIVEHSPVLPEQRQGGG